MPHKLMTYSPPAGWVETLSEVGANVPLRFRFHRNPGCPLIQQPASLRQVDKPYSAPRCHRCAPDNEPTTRSGYQPNG